MTSDINSSSPARSDARDAKSSRKAAPITLKVRDVALAAQRAYDEGRLSAQGPTPDCLYRDKSGRPCAIGAALSDRQAERLRRNRDNDTSVQGLLQKGVFRTDDVGALTGLQNLHDYWCEAEGDRRRDGEAEFVARLHQVLALPSQPQDQQVPQPIREETK